MVRVVGNQVKKKSPLVSSSDRNQVIWGLGEREREDGVGVGNNGEQREMLRFLDGFQRVYVSLQRAQGLLSSSRRLPRVSSPFQRGTRTPYLSLARA